MPRTVIAVDAMGGDNAPGEIVKGACEGSKIHDVDVILVGDETAIREHLPQHALESGSVSIRHASEVVEMADPAAAIRTKKDSSVVVCAELVKKGEAEAMVSMGNTAAAMAIATLKFRQIEGVDRPAIATVFPSRSGATILLDAGAVVECSPNMLKQFGVMGSIYAQKVLKIGNPRVGLLSVGEEKSKGSELIRQAHILLMDAGINFVGNVEGGDLMNGAVDVMVADGFVGNVVLKSTEGIAEYLQTIFLEEVKKHPWTKLPIALLYPSLRRIRKKLDYSEYGGAPLLGLNNMCIIGHGRSKARAVVNACKAAKEAVDRGVVSTIRDHQWVAETEEVAAASEG